MFIFITDETFVQKQVLNPSFSFFFFFNKSWDPQIPFLGVHRRKSLAQHLMLTIYSKLPLVTFFTLKTPTGILWGGGAGSLLYFSDLDSFVLSLRAQRGQSQQYRRKKESTIGKTLQTKSVLLVFFLRHLIKLDKKSNNVMHLKLSS